MEAKSQNGIRVLIIDDHVVVRAGLRMLIESRRGMQVVAEAGEREEALEAAARTSPDIILLDLDLKGESSLEFLPQLREAAPQARVLILTGITDPQVHNRSIMLGAMGVILKDKAAETLLKAIDRVNAGEVWFDRALMGSLMSEMSRARETRKSDPELERIASLTDREREVVTLVSFGLKNKQIAERLFISDTTVRHHLTSIFSKLGVSDRLELVIYSYRHKLSKPPS
jgi:two-component system, NarL family, nitrate/nitrite response regulator NarL